MTIVLLLLLQLNVPDAAQFVGPPKGTPITGQELFARTNEVGALLRCPVCQGMSIADSPAEMAVNMKAQVRNLLARGYTEEQILEYFEKSYGEFVLLRPKSRVLWMLPMFALLVGALIVFIKLRKLEASVPPPTGRSSTAERQPPTDSHDPYLSRVRDLVSGGKQ